MYIYIIKVTRNNKETFPYARKVGCVFSVKEGMRNGEEFLLMKKKLILS